MALDQSKISESMQNTEGLPNSGFDHSGVVATGKTVSLRTGSGDLAILTNATIEQLSRGQNKDQHHQK
jgi:hypothetical protein